MEILSPIKWYVESLFDIGIVQHIDWLFPYVHVTSRPVFFLFFSLLPLPRFMTYVTGGNY